MRCKATLALGLCVVLAAPRLWAAPEPPTTDNVRRFALVIGANHGGQDRQTLRYAVSDAQKVMDVLQKIGGVLPADSVLLLDPTRRSVQNGFSRLTPRLRALKERAKKIELIFYYSGHSDEEAVLLHGEKVYYKELRTWLNQLPADVRIAILDSCSSGAFTRLKGGTVRPPFLEDSAYNMKGFAIMTSSSVDEASQESDNLQSSFFTYYLVTGLRGAADLAQNGRVTLNEAYQYAYSETLAKTERTLSGPQHPNYDIQMTGTGDVIMTDIRNASAQLVLDKSLQGRVTVRNRAGQLMAEVRKPAGREMRLGLENGEYTVTGENNGKTGEAQVLLEFGEQSTLLPEQLKPLKRESTLARGNAAAADAPAAADASQEKFQGEGYRVVPWTFSGFLRPKADAYTIHYYILNFLGSYSAKLDGFSFGLGPTVVSENARGLEYAWLGNYVHGPMEGIQLSTFYNEVGGSFRGLQVTQGANLVFGNAAGLQFASFNYVSEKFTGVQFGLAGNYAGGSVSGSQLGLYNSSLNSNGFQFGLVNKTGEQKGESVGLVNLAKNGCIDYVAWSDNNFLANVGVRFRVNHFYSLISVGSQYFSNSADNALGYSLRFGGHMPVGPVYFESDLGAGYMTHTPYSTSTDADGLFTQWRVLAGLPLENGFSLFAGSGLHLGARTFFEIDDNAKVIQFDIRPLFFGGLQYSH
jgi:hypothetical protein